MTNSTDKAAASAAIRVAPRRGRVRAGVVLDRDGVTVVQSREGIDAIERAAYVAYPADCGNAPEDRAGFAARVIRSVVDKPNDCDVWANLAESVVYVLTLPVVKDADLDAVALLNASRVSPINPDETNFDYRLLGRTAGTDVPSLRAIAVSASQEGCELWRSAFEKAGIKLAGLSSQELVPALLACRTPVDESWTTYAYMTVDAGESVLTLIENGRVALQRNFNFGMDQLLADAVVLLPLVSYPEFFEFGFNTFFVFGHGGVLRLEEVIITCLRTASDMRNLQQPVCWPPSLSKYFLIANQVGTEKINGHPDFDYNEDSVKVLKSPKGTTFVIPNTGGTKAYDAIYGYSLEHIKAVRPKLSWLTQAQLEHDDYLFEKGRQPHRSERFKTKHENWRDSSKQNFVVYKITGDRPTGEVYQVSGDLIKGEQRRVTIVDRFEIRK